MEDRGSKTIYTVLVGLLLFIGIELWFLVMHGLGIRRYQPILLGIALIVAMIPPTALGFSRLLDRGRYPSPRGALLISIGVFIFASLFLYVEAAYQKRAFALRYHDEYSYRIQTQMLARGKLWEPAHPLPEFFENFQLIATPVYASIYFPGAAMLYAPGIWLHLPHWLIPLLASGAVIALVYRVLTELIDGIAGLLGALMLVSVPMFREQSIMVMAQVPAMLGALALIWVFLRWRSAREGDAHGLLSVGFLGAIAGFALITRPIDALIAIVPVGIAMIWELRRVPNRQRIAIVLAGLAGAAPFLATQLIFNRAVTGRFADTPFDFYTRQVYPGGNYGFHGFDPAARPSWPLPQIQAAYSALAPNYLRDHTPAIKLARWATAYIPETIRNVTPHSLLVIFAPVGLLGLRKRGWLLAVMLPLFVLLYFPYVFFIRHYTLIVMPAMFLMILLGMQIVCDLSVRARPHLLTFFVISTVLLLASQWPQFDRLAFDEYVISDPLRTVDAKLASLPDKPAIVLFRFSLKTPIDLEPAYNPDVAWPDDARIIRAHDRGAANIELFRYYAQRQPERFVYIYDRADESLTPLDTVAALAAGKP